MRPIDRVRAIQSIVAKMEGTMNFDDVAVFFNAMDIEPDRDQFGNPIGGSLRTVIRSYIDTCSDAKLVDIAEQFDMGLNLTSSSVAQLGESRYWLPDHFRVFISHVHTEKVAAANLRSALQRYGITCFVAHEDIVTSDEWRDEILRCLNSMDAMVALLSADFNASKWCDQEVGFAVCRDALIIPINKGQQPYGFIEKYQSYGSQGKLLREVAQNIFSTLATNKRTKEILAKSLVKLITTGSQLDLSKFRLQQLSAIKDIENHHWEKMRDSIQAQPALSEDKGLLAVLNPILAKKGVATVSPVAAKRDSKLDDEIPF